MTNSQIALHAHIVAQNAKTLAWVNEDPENRGAGLTVEDPKDWEGYGVYSVEDYELYGARADLYDFYKDVHGIRCGWDWVTSLSLEEIKVKINYLSEIYKADEAHRKAEKEFFAEENMFIDAEQSGDYTDLNAIHEENYVTSQVPLGFMAFA